MVQAVIFDLDGTLVQTERLKARSYAEAARKLEPDAFSREEVLDAFKEVVGLSRREVATHLLERFDLAPQAEALIERYGVQEPWEAYVEVRLEIYEALIADPELIREHAWSRTIELLERTRLVGCGVGLATMSHREQAERVLEALGLTTTFAAVITRDDVEKGKPDPEMYLLAARQLHANPENCLVIEDSLTGVRAARAARMDVVAVSTPFTKQSLHEDAALDKSSIVDERDQLLEVVAARLQAGRPKRDVELKGDCK